MAQAGHQPQRLTAGRLRLRCRVYSPEAYVLLPGFWARLPRGWRMRNEIMSCQYLTVAAGARSGASRLLMNLLNRAYQQVCLVYVRLNYSRQENDGTCR